MLLTCLSCAHAYEVPEGADLRGAVCPRCRTARSDHFAQAQTVRFESAGNDAYQRACACALRGEKEPALAALEEALLGGYDDFDLVEADPALAPIRSHPRYAEILKRFRKR